MDKTSAAKRNAQQLRDQMLQPITISGAISELEEALEIARSNEEDIRYIEGLTGSTQEIPYYVAEAKTLKYFVRPGVCGVEIEGIQDLIDKMQNSFDISEVRELHAQAIKISAAAGAAYKGPGNKVARKEHRDKIRRCGG
jgi:hypothetical protein